MTIAITVDQLRRAGGNPEFLAAICAWAEANGLDPVRVSGQHAVVVIDDQIQYHEVVTTPDGAAIIDVTGDEDVVGTCFRVVPLIAAMPDEWPPLPDDPAP